MADLWHRTASLLASRVLQKQRLFNSDIIREQAIDALLAVSIEAFGLSDVAEDDDTSDDGRFARAVAFMQENLARPISIPDVARAIGMSLRGLQQVYQRRGESTPLLHLRQLRTQSARAVFTAPDDARTVVIGRVAQDLAYTNLGRFSAHYRETFGETPSETLQHTRSRRPARLRST